MCDFLVSKLCPGPKDKIQKWSDKTGMEHLFLIAETTDEKGIFNIGIYVNQGKSIVCLSSQRYKKSKIRKLFKKHGLEGEKNYDHYDKSGKRKLNLFEVEKEEEIFLPPSEKTLELINECRNMKKKKRKTKRKEPPKKKKAKVHDSSSSDEELGNESEDENAIVNIPVKLGAKKRPRPPPKGKNDDSSIDNDHGRKRFKKYIRTLSFEQRKEEIDEIIRECYLEDETKAEEVFAGPEIMDSLKDVMKNFENL